MHSDIRVVIIVNPDLPIGLIANTASTIAIGIGAKLPHIAARQLIDREQRAVDISSSIPVPILQADTGTIRQTMMKAMLFDGEKVIVPFPAFARSMHDYSAYEAIFQERDLGEETIDGLAIAGPSKWVKSLTGALKLLR